MIVGIALIAAGVAGMLLFPGAMVWRNGDDWPGWQGGPMRPDYGPHMPGPWAWLGRLPPIAGARTIDIVATDFAFKPNEITMKVGEAVNLRLVNQGVTVHDLVAPTLWMWLIAPVGQSVMSGFKAEQQGEYEFFCSVPGHREAGMVGRLVVTP